MKHDVLGAFFEALNFSWPSDSSLVSAAHVG